MKNRREMIGMIIFLGIICFSFAMCLPPEPFGDILLVNRYHLPINRVIIGRGINDLRVLQEGSVFLSVELGARDIYVITDDNKVSNSLKVIVVDNVIETIVLNADGALVYNE